MGLFVKSFSLKAFSPNSYTWSQPAGIEPLWTYYYGIYPLTFSHTRGKEGGGGGGLNRGKKKCMSLAPVFTFIEDEAMSLSNFYPCTPHGCNTFNHLSASCHSYPSSQFRDHVSFVWGIWQTHKQSSACVVVNFLSQVIFIFPLFQLHYHTLPYPKAK